MCAAALTAHRSAVRYIPFYAAFVHINTLAVDASSKASVAAALAAWVEQMMDGTFAEEQEILDGGSSPSFAGIRRVSSTLSLSAQYASRFCEFFCADAPPPTRVAELVATYGIDLTEVILWRRGALGYMYIASVFSQAIDARAPRPSASDASLADLAEMAEVGIRELKGMLTLRGSFVYPDMSIEAASDIDKVILRDADTGQLFDQGIWSSVHVLAMAYSSELFFYRAILADSRGDEVRKKRSYIGILTKRV